MMDDYVKREGAIKELLGCVPTDVHEIKDLDVIRVMLALPSADVAPVRHGRWESHTDRFICPICHKEWCFIDNDVDLFSYCPGCGAKMDEETK